MPPTHATPTFTDLNMIVYGVKHDSLWGKGVCLWGKQRETSEIGISQAWKTRILSFNMIVYGEKVYVYGMKGEDLY